ncbi:MULTISPECIES: hypothetical protein [unclassified Exiguobacterium]|uniref:hypothetical protein n=1 Tax=unclassified Exiguobacterium TaxID=2644629 RepID=UPI001BE7FF02|nr:MULTISPECIES: hypothetical protein [unclassified Exiguobacterium]
MIDINTYGLIPDLKANHLENPESSSHIKDLLKQYEGVLIKSLITSFGLDLLFIQDRHGGDVDTIHNVRAAYNGDTRFDGYANQQNQINYDLNGNYDKKKSSKYHSDPNYISQNRTGSIQKKQGTLVDAYTGKTVARNADIDLDHVISAKEIQNDPGRVLAGLDGVTLANQSTNLKHTNRSINRSKGAKTTQEFTSLLNEKRAERQGRIIELKSQSQLNDRDRKELNKLTQLESVDAKKMENAEKIAREHYDQQISKEYYSSSKFLNDTIQASYKLGFNMGLKQALGIILAEVIILIKKEIPQLVKTMKNEFKLGLFFQKISEIIKQAFINVQAKYKEIIQGFANGVLSGILASLVTTLINIFVTSAKHVVKIIRESLSTIVEALNILIINPDNLPYGEVLKAVAILLSTGMSVILGTIVTEAMSKIPALNIPIIGEVLTTFIGASVTGLMSVSLLYYIENSKQIKKIVDWLNQFKSSFDHKLDYFKKVHASLIAYVAELENIDLDYFKLQVEMTNEIANQIEHTTSDQEINLTLSNIVEKYNVYLAYDGTIGGLDDFMDDSNTILEFKL